MQVEAWSAEAEAVGGEVAPDVAGQTLLLDGLRTQVKAGLLDRSMIQTPEPVLHSPPIARFPLTRALDQERKSAERSCLY